MSWLMKDLNYTNEAFAYATNCFTDEEIQQIVDLGKNQPLGKGELENGSSDEVIRNSTISWINVDSESTPLYVKLTELVNYINDKFYKYDLTEMETLQYTEYYSGTLDRYKAHSDDGHKFNLFRKLSFSVQLSDPNEYEGGNFLFYRNSLHEPNEAPKQKGTLIVFPSYVIHEITPVTKGVRRSLVSWVIGPRFK